MMGKLSLLRCPILSNEVAHVIFGVFFSLVLFIGMCHNWGMYVDHQGKAAGKLLHNFIILAVIAVISVCIYFVYDKIQNGLFQGDATGSNACANEEGMETLKNAGIESATKCKPVDKNNPKDKIREVYGK